MFPVFAVYVRDIFAQTQVPVLDIHGEAEGTQSSHVLQEGQIGQGYSRLPNLERLCVSGAKGHRNLSAVHGLRKLYLGQGQPVSKSLTDLNLGSLEELELCQSPIRSLDGLETATGLRKLSLTHCRALSDLSPLENLDSLTALEIDACGRIKDFSLLKSMHNLETLVLFGSNTLIGATVLLGAVDGLAIQFSQIRHLVQGGIIKINRGIGDADIQTIERRTFLQKR